MATQNIKLQKTIISNRYSNDIHSKGFNKLAKSDDPVDEESIKDSYNTVFYSIPKKGKNSHSSLVQRTFDYRHNIKNQQKEQEIERLIENLDEKNEELTSLQSPIIKQHPLYANGDFLVAGENGECYPGMCRKYIMQEGLKRRIDTPLYPVVRKCFDLPYEGETINAGVFFITVPELNKIDDGKHINNVSDLNITGEALKADFDDLNLRRSFYKLEVKCLGFENEDAADVLISDHQFYLQGGCEVQYYAIGWMTHYSSHGGTTNYGSIVRNTPELRTKNLEKGETWWLNVGKNTNRPGDDGVPNNVTYPLIESLQYNGTDVQGYIRQWGEGQKFDGILSVKGRMTYKILEEDRVPQNNNEKVLNGLPNSYSINTVPPGEELSIYGTRIIYPGGMGLYGDQRHEEGLWKRVFSDPESLYYHPFFYGQPIIRHDSDYLVYFNQYTDHTVASIHINTFAFLSLDKKTTNSYPYGHHVDHFLKDGHSEISCANVPRDNAFYNKVKKQVKAWRGNDVDDWMGEVNVHHPNMQWHTIKTNNKLRYWGLRAGGKYDGPDGKNGEPNIGTFYKDGPTRMNDNAFYGYGYIFPWE